MGKTSVFHSFIKNILLVKLTLFIVFLASKTTTFFMQYKKINVPCFNILAHIRINLTNFKLVVIGSFCFDEFCNLIEGRTEKP